MWAIGIALPEIALIDVNESDAFSIAALDVLKAWRTFDFSTELSLRFGAPCWVRSNTEMMTRGEMKAGAGQGVRDLLCVRLDRSISAGLVSDGRLQSGAQGLAGLIGHAPTNEGGDVVCHCGAKGCLDAIASGEAITREAAAAAERWTKPVSRRNVRACRRGHGERRQSRRPARRRLLRRIAGAVRAVDRREPGAAGQSHQPRDGHARRRACALGRNYARCREGGNLPAFAPARDPRSQDRAFRARRLGSARGRCGNWRSRRSSRFLARETGSRSAPRDASRRSRPSSRRPRRESETPRRSKTPPPARPP